MNYLSLRATSVLFASCLVLAGCGGTDGGEEGGGEDGGNGELEPLELSPDQLGVGVHHGAGAALEEAGSAASEAIDSTEQTFSTTMLHLKVYDEFAWRVGEWTVNKAPSGEDREDYRSEGEYQNDADLESSETPLGSFEQRSGDLADEVDRVFGDGAFAETGIVLDFWRSRGDWYVHWEGNLSPNEMSNTNLYGEGDYGFFDSEMTDSIGDQLERVAEEHEPRYLVIGEQMGRLLAREEGPGFGADEFANFRTFYREIAVEIRQSSGSTRVGAGFDWDHFVKYVAPQYGPAEKGTVPSDETLERAFEAVILPFAEVGGMIALESYREPAPEVDYYEFLATLDERFDLGNTELVWYSIGSPIDSDQSPEIQRNFVENFIDWNAGVEPDLIAWRALMDFDGSAQDGGPGAPCSTLRDDERFQMPETRCFDGLIDATSQKKAPFETIEAELP